MTHIAVFTPLVNGHVYPALAVCSELVRRGHRVTYAANDRFAPRIRNAGAEPIEFKAPEIKYADKLIQFPAGDETRYWRTFTAVHAPMIIATAAVAAAELEAFYEANPPDLILYEWFAFAGRILARRFNCPAIQISSHFAHHDSLLRVNGVRATPEPMLAFGALLDAFMSTYGYDEKGQLAHVEELNIFFIPREFQYDANLFDGRFKFVGATHNRSAVGAVRKEEATWKNRAGQGRPLLLISENTASKDDSFLKLCIEAFGDSRYYVVFSKGTHSAEVPSHLLPRNFEINRDAFNCEILPSASIMLCQGGMGTVLESLYHGVPVVTMAPNPFNAEVSYRVAELGLGLYVPELSLTSSVLKDAVETVLSDEALVRRVGRMRDNWKNEPAAQTAADIIEEFMRAVPNAAPNLVRRYN